MAPQSKRKPTSALILSAAGRLFAAKGIDSVTVRDIVAEAGGMDVSLIKYHFGSKDGLLQAVAEYAVAPWQNMSLDSYFAENEALLETRDGQRVFVTGMVEVIFNRFNTTLAEPWCRSFILQFLQRQGDHPLTRQLIERHMKPMVTVFAEVYRRISGNADFETAFCWYLFVTAPLFIHSGNAELLDLLHPENRVGGGFSRRMLYFCTQQVLTGFGLDVREER